MIVLLFPQCLAILSSLCSTRRTAGAPSYWSNPLWDYHSLDCLVPGAYGASQRCGSPNLLADRCCAGAYVGGISGGDLAAPFGFLMGRVLTAVRSACMQYGLPIGR